MDIVKAFQNNEQNVCINIKGDNENPLFRASDVGTVLGLSNINKNISDFSDKGHLFV
jgi:prophage antirepressor-like protein